MRHGNSSFLLHSLRYEISVYKLLDSDTQYTGIYAIGGMKIENVSWSQFVQAVATPDDMYCDGKTIINCQFNAPTGCIFKDFVFETSVEEPEEIIKRFVIDKKSIMPSI